MPDSLAGRFSNAEPPAKLILDDPGWPMPQPGQLHGAPRRLRVYKFPFGGYIAIVTERGSGMTVTSVAEHVYAALAQRYGDVVVIEHHPAIAGSSEEHFLEITIDPIGAPQWHPRWVKQMTVWCGPDVLDDLPGLPQDPAETASAVCRNGPHGAGLDDATVIHGYPGEMTRVILETFAGDPLGDLPHYVYYSPSGYSWGDFTNGAKELARCILAAVLGERARCAACVGTGRVSGSGAPADPTGRGLMNTRRCPSCRGGIYLGYHGRFVLDFVERWPANQPWHITAGQVRSWLAEMAATPQL
jgi:hypothetical protein